MEKQALITVFVRNHQMAVQYINNLTSEAFCYRYMDKWTAGQHLEHILLTIMPFPKVLQSKAFVRDTFGLPDHEPWDFQTVLHHYAQTSLKAPEAYLPKGAVLYHQKTEIIAGIEQHLSSISALLDHYSEDELDSLVLPHPLLGKLSIREMFFLMSYHPLHHQQQIEQMLKAFLP